MARSQLNIKLPQEFRDDVEEHADKMGLNTSEYVREALRQKMARQEE